MQVLVNFIIGFQLTNFDGENVPLATACFNVVAQLLPMATTLQLSYEFQSEFSRIPDYFGNYWPSNQNYILTFHFSR